MKSNLSMPRIKRRTDLWHFSLVSLCFVYISNFFHFKFESIFSEEYFFSSVSNASTLVKACTFDQDTCDWHNIPFDDQGDFKLRSGSSVRGPSSGSGGSGKE